MIKWLLDTNACIAIMNNQPTSVKATLIQHPVAEAAISAISLYELQYGVSKSAKIEQNQKTLTSFLQHIQICSGRNQAALVFHVLRGTFTSSCIGITRAGRFRHPALAFRFASGFHRFAVKFKFVPDEFVEPYARARTPGL